MLDSIIDKWFPLSGRIGRKEYWIFFMLPAGVFILSSRLGLPYTGWAALWFFTLGNVKRFRDLKVSGVAVMGIWWTVMVIATVIGAGLFLFAAVGGMLYGLTGGQLDIGVAGHLEETMVTAAIIFFTPIGILLLVAGFVPGLHAKQSGDLPSRAADSDSRAPSDNRAPTSADSPKSISNGMRVAVVGGVVVLILGSLWGKVTWTVRDWSGDVLFTIGGDGARASDLESDLIQAIRSGRLEVVTGLLEAGADPHQQTGDGKTALKWALESNGIFQFEIASVLMEHGADPVPGRVYCYFGRHRRTITRI